jgi:hypothetical protein
MRDVSVSNMGHTSPAVAPQMRAETAQASKIIRRYSK